MSKIKILPKSIAQKIAAGEVVERPSSIVKELLENSIDADSTFITVEIEDGGKKLIRVSDNGSGINPDEVDLAFIRHATSKIDTEDDLFNITQMGFRGEALYSISAVSKTTMLTKILDLEVGRKISVHGGEIIENNDIRYGRDGIFVNVSNNNVFRGNRMRDLRFAIHYMYANDSEVSDNISINNHVGFALMFSNNIVVKGNQSIADHERGLFFNFTNNSVIDGNRVSGAEKCVFIYNANFLTSPCLSYIEFLLRS